MQEQRDIFRIGDVFACAVCKKEFDVCEHYNKTIMGITEMVAHLIDDCDSFEKHHLLWERAWRGVLLSLRQIAQSSGPDRAERMLKAVERVLEVEKDFLKRLDN